MSDFDQQYPTLHIATKYTAAHVKCVLWWITYLITENRADCFIGKFYKLYRTVDSAVTIIMVTIFIAIFQNYRIISLSQYFLRVRNDIFERNLRYASMIDSPPVYSSFSTLQSRAGNDVTRVIAAWRPWLSSVSVQQISESANRNKQLTVNAQV